MEVQEAKRQGGERRGSALCEAQPPEDLKHRFLCVLLPSILHFHLSLSLFIFSLLSSGLLSHLSSLSEQADLSALRQEICPQSLR